MHPTGMKVGHVILSLLSVVVIWQVIYALEIVDSSLIASPAGVWVAAMDMYKSGILFTDLAVSLRRAATGFLIGSTLGVTLGLLTSRTRFFAAALSPLFILLRPIPSIALVPIAIVWFGIGENSKYFVISYTVFLAVWLTTHHGMAHIPTIYIRASRSLGASRFVEFVQVAVPASAPHIFAGFRLGAALAFLSLVAAELTGASSGIAIGSTRLDNTFWLTACLSD